MAREAKNAEHMKLEEHHVEDGVVSRASGTAAADAPRLCRRGHCPASLPRAAALLAAVAALALLALLAHGPRGPRGGPLRGAAGAAEAKAEVRARGPEAGPEQAPSPQVLANETKAVSKSHVDTEAKNESQAEGLKQDVTRLGIPAEAALEKIRKSAHVGQELKMPETIDAWKGRVSLRMQATKLPTPWVGGHFMTRGYGSIPGPTIRVRPGETLEIELENDLGPGPGEAACNFKNSQIGLFLNPATICMLNHTNIHTHGLHASAEGNGDNIMRTLAPGEKKVTVVKVPDNHMGGTHWYHPHKHHATAAQAGGGAHGALIVDDPPGSLPTYVENMPEKLIFLSLVNIAKALRLENWGLGNLEKGSVGEQHLWKNPLYPDWKWSVIGGTTAEHGTSVGISTGLDPQVVVNGQWQPKVTLDEGKWYRFRFVFAAIEQRVEIHPADTDTDQAYCQYQLISKDGIYLHEAPRAIERIYLVSGSRADVAVSCSCDFSANPRLEVRNMAQRPCRTRLNFTAKWEPMGTTNEAITMEKHTDLLMTIETGNPFIQQPIKEPSLQRFSVRRPCYLADLRSAVIMPRDRHAVDLPQIYPMVVKFDGRGTVWGHKTPSPMARIPVGSLQEWRLSGIRYHPFHTHVNPYQIVQIIDDPYYMPGDWHDTLLPTKTGYATIRMNMDSFTGKMIAHCHLLEHEDNGMMGFVNITGKEGTTSPWVHWLDPQCYHGRFPGPPMPKVPTTWR